MVNLPSKLVRFLHSYTLQPLCLGFLQPIWKVASAWSHLGLSGKLWPNPICTHLWNSAPEPAWRQRETHFHQLPVPCCQVANASWSPRRRRSSRTLGRVQLLQLPGQTETFESRLRDSRRFEEELPLMVVVYATGQLRASITAPWFRVCDRSIWLHTKKHQSISNDIFGLSEIVGIFFCWPSCWQT